MVKIDPELILRAQKHNNYMMQQYGPAIQYSIDNTVEYREPIFPVTFSLKDKSDMSNILLINMDTVTAIHNFAKPGVKLCTLNYASYKNPGGGYIKGMMAQEEALCHHSYLYNVISTFYGYYKFNNKDLNKGLYKNVALYSKDILFDGQSMTDVITCAAPNIGFRYSKATPQENQKALKERIKMVLEIADRHGNDTFIVGAWGCGVFGQNPEQVANLFVDYISSTKFTHLKNIVFAIPDKHGSYTNFKAFANAFKKRGVYNLIDK